MHSPGTVLVTGAAGYIGSICAAQLVRLKYRVVGYDNLSTGHRSAVVPSVIFVRGDISDTSRLVDLCREFRVDATMHFAASALIDESIRDPHRFYRNNVSAGLGLLEALVTCGVKKFLFSSSAAVYGEPKSVPLTEDDPTDPVNSYGETKLVFERALAWYHRAYGMSSISLRYFSAAGATQELGEDHRPETHLLPRLLEAAYNPEVEFQIFGDDYPTPDGTCVRDFVHVLDLAQAHVVALQSLSDKVCTAYNVGCGRGYSVREVAQVVQGETGHPARVKVGPRRAGDPAVLVASPEKIRRELSWRAQYSDLREIVRSAWSWKQRHPGGYGEENKGKGWHVSNPMVPARESDEVKP